jgi:hypothetical protein
MPKKASVTAAELAAELYSDPEWVAQKLARDRVFAERSAKLRSEQEPLMRELAAVGVHYRSLGELLNSRGPYKAGIPVLLSHLERAYSDATREAIARCLAVRDACYAWARLRDLYITEPCPLSGSGRRVKDGLAVAVAATTTEENIESLAALARDASLGSSRVLLLRRLKRSRNGAVHRTLAELAGDPDLKAEIASWKSPKS